MNFVGANWSFEGETVYSMVVSSTPEVTEKLVVLERNQDRILTPEQMAAHLQVPTRHLEDLRRAGRVTHLDLGHMTKRYHLPTVLASLEKKKQSRHRE